MNKVKVKIEYNFTNIENNFFAKRPINPICIELKLKEKEQHLHIDIAKY